MNIQSHSSSGLPSFNRADGWLARPSKSDVSAEATEASARPTRLTGRSDVHATFVYSMTSSPEVPKTGHQVDIYI